MSVKDTQIKIRPVQSVPAEADVCHFDELDEGAMAHLLALASRQVGEQQRIEDNAAADGLENCNSDIVKFTDYYRIEAR